jgi:putative SOS response-associated peptidase YedK
VADKPMVRSAFKRRRCLIPADGYYEWQAAAGGKQPHVFRMRSGEPFAFAGLSDCWQGQDGGAILMTAANELCRPVHDRMPVILPRGAYGPWLNGEIEDARALAELLRPYPCEGMETYPVSVLVNNVRNNRPECCQPC